MTLPPDPRTAPDDEDAADTDAPNRGVSADDPAEGSDDEPAEEPGSPKG